MINTDIRFFLTNKGRLYKIIWRYEMTEDKPRTFQWGDDKQESWDLNNANEEDLMRAFRHLAFGNPKDFKKLYETLKKHDDIVFSSIQQVKQEIREQFNFD